MENQKTNYINIKSIVALGESEAKTIAIGYASESSTEKLDTITSIKNLPIKEEAKIKFIGDILSRPKSKRLAISRKIQEELTIKYGENKD